MLISSASTVTTFGLVTTPDLPGTERHPSSPVCSPEVSLITGLIAGFQAYADVELFAGAQYGSRTIVYFIRNYGIGQNLYGLASAASFLLALVIMVITALMFKFNKWVEYTN